MSGVLTKTKRRDPLPWLSSRSSRQSATASKTPATRISLAEEGRPRACEGTVGRKVGILFGLHPARATRSTRKCLRSGAAAAAAAQPFAIPLAISPMWDAPPALRFNEAWPSANEMRDEPRQHNHTHSSRSDAELWPLSTVNRPFPLMRLCNRASASASASARTQCT